MNRYVVSHIEVHSIDHHFWNSTCLPVSFFLLLSTARLICSTNTSAGGSDIVGLGTMLNRWRRRQDQLRIALLNRSLFPMKFTKQVLSVPCQGINGRGGEKRARSLREPVGHLVVGIHHNNLSLIILMQSSGVVTFFSSATYGIPKWA